MQKKWKAAAAVAAVGQRKTDRAAAMSAASERGRWPERDKASERLRLRQPSHHRPRYNLENDSTKPPETAVVHLGIQHRLTQLVYTAVLSSYILLNSPSLQKIHTRTLLHFTVTCKPPNKNTCTQPSHPPPPPSLSLSQSHSLGPTLTPGALRNPGSASLAFLDSALQPYLPFSAKPTHTNQ